MMNQIKCPVCGSTKTNAFLSYEKSKVYLCNICAVSFLFPFPSEKKLKEYYKEGYFEGEKKGVKGYRDYLGLEENLVKEANLKLAFIKKRIKSGRLLDVGAGTGVFAEVARESGFKVSANDISPFAARALKKRGIKCYTGAVREGILPPNAFDVVTAWDVVEHVSKINEMMQGIVQTLKTGGYFFLTTPDTESIDAKLMGKNWYGFRKIPEHLIFFNKKSITTLFSRWNIDIVEVRRWGFYRDLNFVTEKLSSFDKSFSVGKELINKLQLGKVSCFFPLTDFIVVGKKLPGKSVI